MADQSSSQPQAVQATSLTDTFGATSKLEENVNGSPSYTPQVGDVVEFDRKKHSDLKGIFYLDARSGLTISTGSKDDICHYKDAFNIVKIGYCGDMEDITSWMRIFNGKSADDVTDAYFANQPPTFTGTYAERQQQWIDYHGIKIGDRVEYIKNFGSAGQGLKTVVDEIHGDGIETHWNHDHVPYEILRPV